MAITFETEIRECSGLRYKIQMREVPGGWEQRHIWYPSTPHVTETRVDPWIWSGRMPPGPTYRQIEAAA